MWLVVWLPRVSMDFKEPNKNLYKNTVRRTPRPHAQGVVRLTPARCLSAVRAPEQDARAFGTSQAAQSAGIARGRAIGVSRADWHGLTPGRPRPVRGTAAHQVQLARLPIPKKRLKLTRAVRPCRNMFEEVDNVALECVKAAAPAVQATKPSVDTGAAGAGQYAAAPLALHLASTTPAKPRVIDAPPESPMPFSPPALLGASMAALSLLNHTEPVLTHTAAAPTAPSAESVGALSARLSLGLGLSGRRSVGGGRASMDSSSEGRRVSMSSVGSCGSAASSGAASASSTGSGAALKRLGISGASAGRVISGAAQRGASSEAALARPLLSAAAAAPTAATTEAEPEEEEEKKARAVGGGGGGGGDASQDAGVAALVATMRNTSLAAAPPALDAIVESPALDTVARRRTQPLSPLAPSTAQLLSGGARASASSKRSGAADDASPATQPVAHATPAASTAVVAAAGEGVARTPPVDGTMLAWWLVMVSLPAEEALLLLPLVCRSLRTLAADLGVLAALLGTAEGAVPAGATSIAMAEVLKAYPCGRFLAEGGTKLVYKAFNKSARRWEAMSVVDRRALREAGLESQLQTELWVTHLLGQLRQHGRCPHFLRLHQTFTCTEKPPAEAWGDTEPPEVSGDEGSGSDEDEPTELPPPKEEPRAGRTARKPARATRKPPAGCHQYIMMELAEGGDMEEACKACPGEAYDVAQLPSLLLQMLFSVLAAQRELSLRHYDLKLLNFFLAAPPRAPAAAAHATRVAMRYGVAGRLLELQLPADEPSLVVLADFGTADIRPETLGQPITDQQFTTLENTPPDFLLCGCGANQSFAADAFGLGLCVLHLLTGKAPYEELLAPVRCPAELRAALLQVWGEPEGATYAVVRRQLDAHVDAEDEAETDADADGGGSVLFDTLYRYLCLFGAELGAEEDEEDDDEEEDDDADDSCEGCVANSAAWAAVQGWLATGGGRTRFGRDHAQWSAFHGRNKAVAAAQRRMAALPGSEALLRGLVRFEPRRRWSVARALRSEVFTSLRCEAQPASEASDDLLHYLHYQNVGEAL